MKSLKQVLAIVLKKIKKRADLLDEKWWHANMFGYDQSCTSMITKGKYYLALRVCFQTKEFVVCGLFLFHKTIPSSFRWHTLFWQPSCFCCSTFFRRQIQLMNTKDYITRKQGGTDREENSDENMSRIVWYFSRQLRPFDFSSFSIKPFVWFEGISH